MKRHTFFEPQADHVETGLWIVIVAVVLLAIALAGLPAIAPPQAQAPPRHAPAVVHTPTEYAQGRLRQLVADMRTLVAALHYLMQPENEPSAVA